MNRSGRPPAEQSRAKDREARKAAQQGGVPIVDDGVWLTLPHAGRPGAAPAWPLSKPARSTPRHRRELEVWRRLWKLPQAVAWERSGPGTVWAVALHVRTLVRAEDDLGAPASLLSLVRLQAAGLGLTPAGLRDLRWRIGRPPAEKTAAEPKPSATVATVPSPPPAGRSPKDRMRLVPPS